MRALVTGATGFAGRWLMRELLDAGHDAIAAPPSAELDVADAPAVAELLRRTGPDVVAHLAAVASARDVERDPAAAVRTNLGGMISVTRAVAATKRPAALLVVSSAEVYAPPAPGDPPLTEDAPVAPRAIYGLLKLAGEAIAMEAARRDRMPLVVVRSFNHTGPGQPAVSAVASFVERIASVRRGVSDHLRVGDIDVERDIGDVRDVVRAYRLLLEGLARGQLGHPPGVFNIATGRATRLRSIVEELCRLADVAPVVEVDPSLLRTEEPPRIVGDASALRAATGWAPRFELRATLADMLATFEHG